MVTKPEGRVMSALLWCELMNWLGQRPAVYILVPVMSRSLRIIMSARRPPLSQSLLRLASMGVTPDLFPGVATPTPSWLMSVLASQALISALYPAHGQ